MPLDPGTRLGHYEILALIGAGGMGEVYRARDPRLGREVAVKVSAERFSERFEREARVIASLNHPNICTLHDVGPNYLVMELVEGESPQGPLPYEIAMNYARQIAEALEAAHEKGIVHRDLKPGNIKIKPDGTVKVLDFGLAKVGGVSTAPSENSPTISMAATQAGVILGTAAYMAPEQARGKPVDRRADIWAFGVVLYELLTGERLFQGEDLTETLASVVKQDPDLSRAPARVRRLLKSCLEKDPKKRLQAIGDMRLLLEEPEAAALVAPQRTGPWAWIAAGLLGVALAVVLWAPWRPAPSPPVMTRFEIYPPAKTSFTNWMSLSPDGRKVAFTARAQEGSLRLWVRSLDSLEARPLIQTNTNPVPFWSPDSRYIAYQIDGKLKKVEVGGGSAQTLCDAPNQFFGGAWNQENVIVFSGTGGLMRVSAAGGVPQQLTSLDASKQETSHGSPAFMPDGRHFIYFRRSSVAEYNGIFTGSLDDAPDKGSPRRLSVTAVNPLYAPPSQGDPGYLMFARDNALLAQPFDADKMEFKGEATLVADPVGRMSGRFLNAAVSSSGVLIYRSSGIADLRQLTWFETDGKAPASITESATFSDVALSPDGTRAVVALNDEQQSNYDLWTVDLAKVLKTRFTFDKAEDRYPVWSPDGNRIVFASVRDGSRNLYWKASNGATDEELLLKTNEEKIPSDWSRDGKYLLYSVADPKTKADIWYLPLTDGKAGERKGTRFLGSEFTERQGRFSPDGHYVAYSSDESGGYEIYVRSFPDAGGRWQVSKKGGTQPRWRKDGKQLYYLAAGTRIMSVDVTTGTTFQSGDPKALVDARVPAGYDVTGDGKRFLIATTAEEGAADPISVVLNWKAALKR